MVSSLIIEHSWSVHRRRFRHSFGKETSTPQILLFSFESSVSDSDNMKIAAEFKLLLILVCISFPVEQVVGEHNTPYKGKIAA